MTTQTSAAYSKVLTEALQLPTTERIAIIAELAVSVRADTQLPPEILSSISEKNLNALLSVEPRSPREILEEGLLGTWQEDLESSDGAEWVNRKKQQRRVRKQWSTP